MRRRQTAGSAETSGEIAHSSLLQALSLQASHENRSVLMSFFSRPHEIAHEPPLPQWNYLRAVCLKQLFRSVMERICIERRDGNFALIRSFSL
jgi:hypothetical protein